MKLKQPELIALGLAGVAVYLIAKSKGGLKLGIPALKTNTAQFYDRTTEILNNGQNYENGWRYFSDGTAIDQAGNYYKDGQLIWSAPNVGVIV